MPKTYYNVHNHTMYSNTRFADAINSVKGLILNAYKKGLAGVSISEHQSLVSHWIAQKDIRELKQEYPHMFDHFRVTYGDEIYLVDRREVEDGIKRNHAYHKNHCQGDYTYTHFNHFILTARNEHGYELLLKLNQYAWQDSFMFGRFRMQRRLPTYKDWLAKEMKDYKGDVVASTACLGSELSQDLTQYNYDKNSLDNNQDNQNAHQLIKELASKDKLDTKKLDKLADERIKAGKNQTIKDDKKKIHDFLHYLITTFGKENVYFELMPSLKKHQKIVNKYLWSLSQRTGIKTIISTDSHFTDKNNEKLHQSFLQAEQTNRDVYDFYHYAHLFSYSELERANNQPHFKFFNDRVLQISTQNSLDLLKTIQQINLDNVTITADEKKVLRNTLNDAKRVNRKIGKRMVYNVGNVANTIKSHWYGMN